MVDMRPHEHDDEGAFSKTLAFDSEEMSLATADMLLTTLAELVRRANLPSAQCLWVLYGIGKLRGHFYSQSRRIGVEAKGRSN